MPKKTSFIDLLRIFLQYVFARHVFSLLVAYLSHNENETLKNLMIKRFGKRYKINTKESISQKVTVTFSGTNAAYIVDETNESKTKFTAEEGIL
ncbi:MAG: hypothetical protein ACU85E_17375, partial [Gammaproteobacteria bacterium]